MRERNLVVLSLLLISGCASSGTIPVPRSVLAQRAPQTRSYETDDRRALLSAMVQGLQDAGFQIAQVDFEAGFVSANAERVSGKEAPGVVKFMFYPYSVIFPGLFGNKRHTILDATGTVVAEGAVQRVRIQCRIKVLDASGGVKQLQEVDDAKFYQDLFARIDKAVFLAREQL